MNKIKRNDAGIDLGLNKAKTEPGCEATGTNLLANWAFPRASITIHLQVGFKIETLNVLALVAPGR